MNKMISAVKNIAYAMILPVLLTACQSNSLTSNQPVNSAIKPELAAAGAVKAPDREDKARLVEAYGKTPMGCEQNAGQTNDQVKFLGRGHGYTLFLTPSEAVLKMQKTEAETPDS